MPPGVLALTITAFYYTGQELESDVGLNSIYGPFWHTDGSDLDVETALLHEDGHVAGLDHSPDPQSIMFASYLGVRRSLAKTDLDAMAFLYPTKPATLVDIPAAYGFRVLARLGDPAPGGGVFQNDFEPGALNARGDLAFVADVPEGEGLFVAANGQLRQVARSGDSLAGFTLGHPGAADVVGLDDAGDVAFAWLFDPFGFPFGANAGLFLAQGSTVRALVVPGTPAPGGGVFDGALAARISNRGDVLFTGVGGGGYGVFVARSDGSIVKIARPGEPGPRGGVFLAAAGTAITNRGDVGFNALTTVARFAVYVAWASGQIDEIAGPGDPAPGGGTFFDARSPRVNAHGDVLFGGRSLLPNGVLSRGIYLAHGGSIERVAGFGDVMPDGWRYVTAATTVGSWSLNDRGEVAFMAVVENDAGVRARAVYAGRPGALALVARVGTVVPGLGGILAIPTEVNDLLIDERGDVAFVPLTTAGLTLVEAAPKA